MKNKILDAVKGVVNNLTVHEMRLIVSEQWL